MEIKIFIYFLCVRAFPVYSLLFYCSYKTARVRQLIKRKCVWGVYILRRIIVQARATDVAGIKW